ncbi:Pentatricopeptide repeat-containing protein [Striga hermonthica]|uniref:Pentatricopeptide repeat-containing protein n=1 Tax=Striga hermonthica TaxID=68872 RepID=A0A9N7MHU7_STRHE|nr:Pentatricopeptide repeat-containing protein [Striga hermonthica]
MASASVVCAPPLTTSSAMDAPVLKSRIQVRPEPAPPKPNPNTDSLKSCKSFLVMKQLHCQLTKQGQISSPPILTKLIAKYSEMGTAESLENATKAFAILKSNRDSFNITTVTYLYNSLIRGNSLAGVFDESVLLYVNMLIEGLRPDNYTFPFVLRACAKSLKLFEGKQIHASILKTGYCDDIFISNTLIYFYGECGETDSARKVFDIMPETNVVTWTSLICAYSVKDLYREAICLFFEMVDEGVEPNEVTMVSVISSCAKLGDRILGEKVAGHVRTIGLKANGILVSALVDMYMKCKEPDKARRLFDEHADGKNLDLYNTAMSNYVKMGKTNEAVDLFREMLESGLRPDRVTMLSVITSSAELIDFHLGMQCHAYILRNGLESRDNNIGNSLIDMYTKCDKLEWARRVFDRMPEKTAVSWNSLLAGFTRNSDLGPAWALFDRMPERNIVSWNTMIGALVQQSLFTDAIALFHRMQKESVIIPDEVTMVSVASACGYLGAHDLAKWTYNYIKKCGIRRNVCLNTSLVDMFGRCGDPRNAMRVFNEMGERDISAWTAAIGAMAMVGNGKEALKLFHEMLGQGVVPDPVVFSTVLTACSHAGLVEQGMNIFNRMMEHGVAPHVVHYGCVVDLFGRAGLLDRALDFIREMPVEPNGEVWSAFLAACRVYKNEKMAALASGMIDKLGCEKTGLQVLLSNMYAHAGKWDDVAKVRTHMKEKGMKKIPGSSSLEIDGTVYEFTSGDESHNENERTSLMLEEINCRIGKEGYVPDLTNVLLDIDEREKEFSLGRHSEKLAIAYGLVSSVRGMPLRIVKNLRMCSDCHSFAKMVSKVYEREIVIRDNNRFHFFWGGSCSCHDYW